MSRHQALSEGPMRKLRAVFLAELVVAEQGVI